MAECTAKPILNQAASAADGNRHVLLLQGPSSFFSRDLGRALRAKGANVTRIAFNAGDCLFWSNDAGTLVRFSEKPAKYHDWILETCRRQSFSDIVMLGDGRFYHKVVADMVRSAQIRATLHVFEHGLIRPGLILVDPNGLGGNSMIRQRFASDRVVRSGRGIDHPDGGSFLEYAVSDVVYHLAGIVAAPFVNRNYVRHSVDHPLWEYAGWVRKLFSKPFRRAERAWAEARIARNATRDVFLFPLQLATDFQVRDHGAGEPMQTTLARVIESFAKHAPKDGLLVIKRHPLDNGWTPWRRLIRSQADRLGVAGRVEYVDGGSLDALLERSVGVVTINSTVGLTAILKGMPCCVLGTAVYDIEGLTSSGGLDVFWRDPKKPDSVVTEKFRSFLLWEYHVPGTFDGPGAKVGANALADRICGERLT